MGENNFLENFEAFNAHVQQEQKGFMLITHLHCEGYEGMVLAILFHFDVSRGEYILTLEWMCLGLDLYGDTLQEYYRYRFNDLKGVTAYLFSKYGIYVNEIPLKYNFPSDKFPNPIYHGDRKAEFEEAWGRFQEDFKEGKFLDAQIEKRRLD